MSKKAMKLALEALETERDNYQDWDKEDGAPEYIYEAISALREALAQPDFWEGYVPEPVKPAQCAPAEDGVCEALDCSNHKPAQQEFVSPGGGYVPAIPAQQALDKKAENAIELGLDYEPAQQYSATSDHRLMENAQGELERIKLVQTGVGIGKPEQEPVAPKCGAIIEVFGKDWRLEYMSLPVGKHKLYTQQYTYISPPAQRTWVGLTDEEFENAWSQSKGDVLFRIKPFALAVEAKLKEKNNG